MALQRFRIVSCQLSVSDLNFRIQIDFKKQIPRHFSAFLYPSRLINMTIDFNRKKKSDPYVMPTTDICKETICRKMSRYLSIDLFIIWSVHFSYDDLNHQTFWYSAFQLTDCRTKAKIPLIGSVRQRIDKPNSK